MPANTLPVQQGEAVNPHYFRPPHEGTNLGEARHKLGSHTAKACVEFEGGEARRGTLSMEVVWTASHVAAISPIAVEKTTPTSNAVKRPCQ